MSWSPRVLDRDPECHAGYNPPRVLQMGVRAAVTSTIKTGGKNVIKMGHVFGAGMENHLNDAPPVDIGPIPNPGNPTMPFKGKSLPFRGLSAFYNYVWNNRWVPPGAIRKSQSTTAFSKTPGISVAVNTVLRIFFTLLRTTSWWGRSPMGPAHEL
jgi:hypothetical protein